MQSIRKWYRQLFTPSEVHGRKRATGRQRRTLELLEDRLAPAVFTVLHAGDSGADSLRQAILDAASNMQADTIAFDASLAGQTITLTSDDGNTGFGPTALVIQGDDITIDGGSLGITLSGNNARRIFAVSDTGILSLSGLTLSGGRAQGGNGGATTADGGGGGGGAGLGGAIFNEGSVTIVGALLTDNAAQGGNGGTAISGPFGGGGGGGGRGGNGTNASGSTAGLGGDLGGGDGGDGHAGPGSSGAFGGGGGGGGGGPFGAAGGSGGFGGGGGGGGNGNFGGTAGLGGGNGASSSSGGGGGGGAGMGGGIFNNQGGSLVITNSTLTGNTAQGGTGGSNALSGTAANGNGLGGAVFNRNGGTVDIRNSTIAGNTATQGGAVFNHSDTAGQTASLTLTSSILANSTASEDLLNLQSAGTATITASEPNVVETAIVNTGGTVDDSGVLNVDPQLGALASNNRPTRSLLPQSGSPAINAGSNPFSLTTDQGGAGFPRELGGEVDLGAVETSPPAVAPSFSSANHATFVAGSVGLFTVVATGTPTAAISSMGTLPSGVTFVDSGNGTATLSGTPAVTSGGVYNLAFTANNGVNPNATQNFTLTVNQAPTFTNANSASFTLGSQGNFTVSTAGFPLVSSIMQSGTLPTGLNFVDSGSGTATLSGTPAQGTAGIYNLTFTADNGVTPNAIQNFTLTVHSAAGNLFAVGADAGGGPNVKVYNPDGSLRFDFYAFNPGFTGGVRVALGDIDGDGADDILAAAGPGGGPHVKVYSGDNLSLLFSFYAYTSIFQGGVYVAADDVNQDGQADIITGAGEGGGPHVRVFSGADLASLSSFYAFSPDYLGGVRVAAGDVNLDSHADIITAAGAGGQPHVKVFSGANLALLHSFLAFDSSFNGGLFVAAGDVDGDNRADIITGAGPGATPHVKVFSGINLSVLQSFFAFDAAFTGGVRVGAADLNGDGMDDILLGACPTGSPHVKALNGLNLAVLDDFFAFDPLFLGGVYVG